MIIFEPVQFKEGKKQTNHLSKKQQTTTTNNPKQTNKQTNEWMGLKKSTAEDMQLYFKKNCK